MPPPLQPSTRPGCHLIQKRGGAAAWWRTCLDTRKCEGLEAGKGHPQFPTELPDHWGATTTRNMCGTCSGIGTRPVRKSLGTAPQDRSRVSPPGWHLQTPGTPRLASPVEMLLFLGKHESPFTYQQPYLSWSWSCTYRFGAKGCGTVVSRDWVVQTEDMGFPPEGQEPYAETGQPGLDDSPAATTAALRQLSLERLAQGRVFAATEMGMTRGEEPPRKASSAAPPPGFQSTMENANTCRASQQLCSCSSRP